MRTEAARKGAPDSLRPGSIEMTSDVRPFFRNTSSRPPCRAKFLGRRSLPACRHDFPIPGRSSRRQLRTKHPQAELNSHRRSFSSVSLPAGDQAGMYRCIETVPGSPPVHSRHIEPPCAGMSRFIEVVPGFSGRVILPPSASSFAPFPEPAQPVPESFSARCGPEIRPFPFRPAPPRGSTTYKP